ncbi:aspartate-semialdehyde dehydrogenase [Bacteroidota bacterium]
MNEKIPIGILGATGSVGQKIVELLTDHPWFEVSELAASEKSFNKTYYEATNWILSTQLNTRVGNLRVKRCSPNLNSRIVLSALDSSVAGEIELEFAKSGYIVISNARNHRFDKNVPLIIPEINPEHLGLIKTQEFNKGMIVTNPNCSTIGLVIALKPLNDMFGIRDVNVVTLQAISGGGYPGIASMDILDNVIPYINGEEDKLKIEPLKILGKFSNNGNIDYANINISAQCNRVSVLDGHLECVQINLLDKTNIETIKSCWNNFKGIPQKINLPSAPEHPIIYFNNDFYPQPRMHRNLGNGMSVSIGRLRECELFDYKFVVLSHNTMRGAAGGTVLLAELMKAKGYFEGI